MHTYTLIFTCDEDPDQAYNVRVKAQDEHHAWLLLKDKLRKNCVHSHTLVSAAKGRK